MIEPRRPAEEARGPHDHATRAIVVTRSAAGFLSDKDGAQVLLCLKRRRHRCTNWQRCGAAPFASAVAAASPAGVRGTVRDPESLRDALLTAAGGPGQRPGTKASDRTAYPAYLAKKGKRATVAIPGSAAFLDESLATDGKPLLFVLPPL